MKEKPRSSRHHDSKLTQDKNVDNQDCIEYINASIIHAGVVKLVNAADSKSAGRKPLSVRFRPPAPRDYKRGAFWGAPFYYAFRGVKLSALGA